MTKRILTIVLLIWVNPLKAQDILFLESILEFSLSEERSARLDQLNYQSELYSEDIGLYFNSSVNHRYGEGFIEEDLSINNLQTYYKTGLSWNILKNGWFQHRNTSKQFQAKAELQKFLNEIESNADSYYAQFALTEYIFNEALIQIIKDRENELEAKQPLYRKLSDRGYLTSTETNAYYSRVQEVGVQSRILESSNSVFEQIFEDEISTYLVPVYELNQTVPEIDMHRLIEAVDQSPSQQQLLMLRQQENEQPSFWANEISLAANIYYNHQVSYSDERRDFTSVGLSFSVPLTRNNYLQHQAYLASNKVFEEEFSIALANRKKELMMLFREYSFKYQQLNATKNKYTQITELQQKDYYQRSTLNTEMPIVNVSLYEDDKLILVAEQIEIAKQMTKLLLKMQQLIPDYSITEFLQYSNSSDLLTERKQ